MTDDAPTLTIPPLAATTVTVGLKFELEIERDRARRIQVGIVREMSINRSVIRSRNDRRRDAEDCA